MTTNAGTYLDKPPKDSGLNQDEWDNLSYDMQYYYANEERREYIKKKSKEVEERNRQYVQEVKKNAECSKCDEDHPATLDFHHTGTKKDNISTLVIDEYSIDTIKSEIEGCEILCANCHRKLHSE